MEVVVVEVVVGELSARGQPQSISESAQARSRARCIGGA
jgi:hypothetical protein